jgi:predicted GNAT family acetyltransferase
MDSDTIANNRERHRYELSVDGQIAHADYKLEGKNITFTHTSVPEALEGQGIASRLIAHALGDARDQGLSVIPQCPFVAAYIEKHPEWADLLAGAD